MCTRAGLERLDVTRQRTKFAVLGIVALAGSLFWWSLQISTADAAPVSIEIDPGERFQTMSGWEATLNLSDTPATPEWAAYHDQLLDNVINRAGINRVRLEIRSGAENPSDAITRFINGEMTYEQWKPLRYPVVNDNDDPTVINWDGFNFDELDWHVETNLLPMMDLAEARGERLMINLCYVAFISGWNAHHDPDEYAELVLATYLHLQEKYGFVPDAWEVILEPDLKPDMWTGKMIGEAIVATAPVLKAHGFEPAFIVPSVTNMRNAVPYIKDIAKVPGAMDYVVEFSYHRYRGANRTTLRAISDLADKYDVGTAMLEWWFGRADHNVLHEDLEIGHNVAWQGRAFVGLFNVTNRNRPEPTFRLRKEVRYNAQYFRHIRHGATRIGATSSKKQKMAPLAFENTDGSTVLVIKASEGGDIAAFNLPAGAYEVSYAIEKRSGELPEPVLVGEDGKLNVTMPGAGVMTISSYRIEQPS